MSIYNTALEINGIEDAPVTVHYEEHPFCAGARDGLYGPKIEPDEPAWIEIDFVHDANGCNVSLTPEQFRALRDEIADDLDQQDKFAESEWADGERDRRADR